MTKSKKSLTATKLRLILASTIVLIVGLTVFGFYQASKVLTSYAAAVAQANGLAHVSESNIQRLQNTKTELEKNQQTIERIKHITADPATYQNQVITDITAYAQQASIKVVGFTFDSTAASGTASPAAPATPGTVAAATPAGVKTTTVIVQLEPTVSYTNFLRFIHSIEQNLTQMRISKISLTKASGTDSNMIAGQSLSIEVYTK